MFLSRIPNPVSFLADRALHNPFAGHFLLLGQARSHFAVKGRRLTRLTYRGLTSVFTP